ncbi:MAG: ParB/RepB/Spo0J family partition protein [Eubacteriales bacterium]|nr:ParB/RepB/Spo0J family partition protein [Eubacteriales bacterium]
MNLPGRDKRRVLQLPAGAIRPNPMQPRKSFDEEGLRELAESVKRHGILQPLTVRRTGGGWELVAGERRLRAAKLAHLTEVPCILIHVDDEESSLLSLIENLQRRDLDFFEVALGYQRLIRVYGLTQEQTAARVGKSQSSVANKLRLLRFDDSLIAFIRSSGLTERHARSVLRLPDSQFRTALEHIASQGLTVAQTEAYVESLISPVPAASPEPPPQPRTPAARPRLLVRDARIFLNTINRAFSVMRDAGIAASCEREELPDAVELRIRIPKTASGAPQP